MKQIYYLLSFLFFSTVYIINASVLDNLSSWWGGTTEIVTREHILTPDSTFKIENNQGNLTIKTWKQNKLIVEAVKKGSKEGVENTNITTHYTKNGASIRTVQKDSQTKCTVDYTILIPNTTTINLAHTDHGNITIKNTQKPIKAQTYKGSIDLSNITNSAEVNTKNGNIKIHAKNLTPEHKVLAVSGRGNISLQLPAKTNAHLYAKTQRGKVSSDHPITLERRTMQISQKTMADLRRDVKGFIGGEEGAIIKLHTSSGNVKLIET